MKRLLRAIAVAALATALLPNPGTAEPVEPRVQTLEYVGGGVSIGPQRSTAVRVGSGVGAVEFRGGPERFVTIVIQDAHGQPVTGSVVQPGEDEETLICGETEKPLKVRPYEKVTVFLMNGVCGDAGASVATTGTVTATFSQTR